MFLSSSFRIQTRISQLERECRETRAENDSLLSRFERLRLSAAPPEEVAALRARARAAEAASAEATRERARASDEGMAALRQLAVLRQLHEAQERESREREEALQALGRRLKEALEEAAAAQRAVDLAAEESERRARALEASETALADARRDAGELAERLVSMKAEETRRLADADAARQDLIADAKRTAAAIVANAKIQSAQESLERAERDRSREPHREAARGAPEPWNRSARGAPESWDRSARGAPVDAHLAPFHQASPSGRMIRDAWALDSPNALGALARAPGETEEARVAGETGETEETVGAPGEVPKATHPVGALRSGRAPDSRRGSNRRGEDESDGSVATTHLAERETMHPAPPSATSTARAPDSAPLPIGASRTASADHGRALGSPPTPVRRHGDSRDDVLHASGGESGREPRSLPASLAVSASAPGAPSAPVAPSSSPPLPRASSAEAFSSHAANAPSSAPSRAATGVSSGSSGSSGSGGLASTASSLTHSLAARIGPDPRQQAMAAAAAAAATLGSALGRAFSGRRPAGAEAAGQGSADLGQGAASSPAGSDHPLAGAGRPSPPGARRAPAGAGLGSGPGSGAGAGLESQHPVELGVVSSSPMSGGTSYATPSPPPPPPGAVSSSYRPPPRRAAPPAQAAARGLAAPPAPVLSPQRLSGALLAHPGGAYCLAASPNGQVMASGGADATVALWDVRKGLATAPDASQEAGMASYGGSAQSASLRARPPAVARPAARLRGAFESLSSLAFTLDSRFVLGAEARAAVRAWDVSTGRLRASLTGHAGRVSAVAASPVDAASAASAGADRTVKIWGLDRGYCVRTILCASACRSIAYSRDGTALLTAHADGALRAWDLRAKHGGGGVSSAGATGSLEVAGLHAGPFGVVVGRSRGLILTGGRDGRLRLLDPRRFGALATLGARGFDPGGSWPSFDLAPDESRVAAGAADGSVFLWDVRGDPQALSPASPLYAAAAPPPVDPTTPARHSGRLRVDGAGEPPGTPTAATVANRAILSLAWGTLGAPLAVGTKGGVVAFFGDAGIDHATGAV